MNTKGKFIKNSLWSFFTAIISRAGTLVFTILLARLLTPEKYGLYSIVFAVAMILFGFTDLGINQTFTRYISLALAKNKKKQASYYSYLLKLKFFLTSGICFLLVILAYPLSKYVFHNMSLVIPFVISAVYVFVYSFESFYTQIFYSLEKVSYLSFKEFLNQSLKIIFIILVVYTFSENYVITGLFLSFILISVLLLRFVISYSKRLAPEIYSKTAFKINTKRVHKFIFYLTITSIFGIIFSYIDTITLGIFLKPEFVGYYRAALSLIIGIAGLLSSSNVLILPLLMKTKQPYQVIFNQIQKYLFLFSIPASFGILSLGNHILRLFYGYEYLPATTAFYLLAFLIPLVVCSSAFTPFFSAKEIPKITAIIVLTSSIVNIILNFILVKIFLNISDLWAVSGVALSVLASWLIYIILSLYFLKKKFNLSIKPEFIIKPVIAGLAMFLIIWLIKSLVVDITPVIGGVLVVVGIVTYFLALFLIKSLTREDLYLIKCLFKR